MSHKFTDQSNRHAPNITPKFKLFFIMSIFYTSESSHIIQQFGIHSSGTLTHSTQRTTDKAIKFSSSKLGFSLELPGTTTVVLAHGSSTQYCSTSTKYFPSPDEFRGSRTWQAHTGNCGASGSIHAVGRDIPPATAVRTPSTTTVVIRCTRALTTPDMGNKKLVVYSCSHLSREYAES